MFADVRLAFSTICLCIALHPTHAGPLSRTQRAASDFRSNNDTLGGCSIGDLVYLTGDEVPGRNVCEKCVCGSDNVVRCSKQECDVRPGCKALHRPDVCCPTYQCECEKDGKRIANGEKIVDPDDPCKVCYCQSGEVVCQLIACFTREDCTPRMVPGRCCPEYDHCPVKGVSTERPKILQLSTELSSSSPTVNSNPAEITKHAEKENLISTTEATLSNGIKIKELLPSMIEVNEYGYDTSSKAPPIPREITPEKHENQPEDDKKKSSPVIKVGDKLLIIAPAEVDLEKLALSTPASIITVVGAEGLQRGDIDESITMPNEEIRVNEVTEMPMLTAKAFDLQDVKATTEEPKLETAETVQISLQALPANVDEEESTAPEHNPEYPPLPDDLSRVHIAEEENQPESVNTELNKEVIISGAERPVFSLPKVESNAKSSSIEQPKKATEKTPEVIVTSSEANKVSTDTLTVIPLISKSPPPFEEKAYATDETPAIMTEATEQYITSESDSITNPTLTSNEVLNEDITKIPIINSEEKFEGLYDPITFLEKVKDVIDTEKAQILKEIPATKKAEVTTLREVTTIGKSIDEERAIDATSIPVIKTSTVESTYEATKENLNTEKPTTTTESLVLKSNPPSFSLSSTNKERENDNEIIMTTIQPVADDTTSQINKQETRPQDIEVETIKPQASTEKPIGELILPPKANKNVLTDLMSLVDDMASIGDEKTEVFNTVQEKSVPSKPAVLDPGSSEFIPVSKNFGSSNFNKIQGDKLSATSKIKYESKYTEIDDDVMDGITDSTFTFDGIKEPTTRRPLIDNVTDDQFRPNHDKQSDIEVIKKVNISTDSRPNKLRKKNSENPILNENTVKTVTTDVPATNESKTNNETSKETKELEISTKTELFLEDNTQAETTTPQSMKPAILDSSTV